MLSDYLPIVAGIGVALVSSGSALIGVSLSQKSAHRLQESQAKAAAELDRARREYESAEEAVRRKHEVDQKLWQKRCEAYADFSCHVDELVLLGLLTTVQGGTTIEKVAATNGLLTRAESMLYLVASKQTAKVAVLLAQSVRGLGSRSGKVKQDERMDTIRQAQRLFLRSAREDLGITGDFLDFAYSSSGGDQAARPEAERQS